MSASPAYFFTSPDPDYLPKGSRDPLGFQTIWQQQGREVFPYLSTVSSNLTDFQILAWAHFLYGREPDQQFYRFFMKFEQAMAYTRYRLEPSRGFNGIDAVRKRLAVSSKVSVSATAKDGIMSNQRTYAIWGKYSRPFRDIKITQDPEFQSVFQTRLSSMPEHSDIKRLIEKLKDKDRITTDVTEFDVMRPFLKAGKHERQLFDRYLLRVSEPHENQNRVYDILVRTGLPEEMTLENLLLVLRKHMTSDENLRSILADVDATNRLLYPFDAAFRHLQTKPRWEKAEIEGHRGLRKLKKPMKYNFSETTEAGRTKNKMVRDLGLPLWDFVGALVRRNTEVSAWRNGKPWMAVSRNVLEVNYPDGAIDLDHFVLSPMGYDFFFGSYTSLFSQIRGPWRN